VVQSPSVPSQSLSGSPSAAALDRRRFLTLSSAGVAALSLGGLARSAEAATDLAAVPLSVGYLVNSTELPSFDALTWRPYLAGADPEAGPRASWVSPYAWHVEPAHRLPIGEQELAGETIEVRVHGLYPEPPGRSWFVSAHLDVLYPAPAELEPVLGRGAMLPHFAWSLSPRSVPSPSPPNRFDLPLGHDGGLDLRLRVSPGRGLVGGGLRRGRSGLAAPAEWRFATRFTVDTAAGMPRLCRGVYFLGLAPDVWRQPVLLPGPGEPERPDLCSIVISVEQSAGEQTG